MLVVRAGAAGPWKRSPAVSRRVRRRRSRARASRSPTTAWRSRPGARGVGQSSSCGPLQLLLGDEGPLHLGGEASQRRLAEQGAYLELHVELVADRGHHPGRGQRMPAEVEEVSVSSDVGDREGARARSRRGTPPARTAPRARTPRMLESEPGVPDGRSCRWGSAEARSRNTQSVGTMAAGSAVAAASLSWSTASASSPGTM